MFDFNSILKIMQGGANAVATADALIETVIATFSDNDQAKLRDALKKARAATDSAHASLQDKLNRASR